MSRHRAIRNLDFEEELYEEEEYDDYEERTDQDLVKLEQGLKSIKAKIGTATKIPDKEIKDTLWYYYFDQNKTIGYLTKTYKLKPPNDVSESHSVADTMGQDNTSSVNFNASLDKNEVYSKQQESISTPKIPSFKLGPKALPSLSSLKAGNLNTSTSINKLPSISMLSGNKKILSSFNKPSSDIDPPLKGSDNKSTLAAALSALSAASPEHQSNLLQPKKMTFSSLQALKNRSTGPVSLGQGHKNMETSNSDPNTLKFNKDNLPSLKQGIQNKLAYPANRSFNTITSIPKLSVKPELFSPSLNCSDFAKFLFIQDPDLSSSTQNNLKISDIVLNQNQIQLDNFPSCLDSSLASCADPYSLYRSQAVSSDSSEIQKQKSTQSPSYSSSNTLSVSNNSNAINNFLFLVVDIDQPVKTASAVKQVKNQKTKPSSKNDKAVNQDNGNNTNQLNKLQNNTLDNSPANLLYFTFNTKSPDDIVFLAQNKDKGTLKSEAKSSTTAGTTANSKVSDELSSEIGSVSLESSKQSIKKINILEKYKNRNSENQNLSLVVVGHVDSGKSTLMGRLLFEMGKVSDRIIQKFERDSARVGKSSFAYAWVLDETDRERERGVTVGVATRAFQTDKRRFTLLDAPGHRDFVPNMISGASQADIAILVIDTTLGGFESGFERDGQTREHTMLLKSLGIKSLIIAMNKMETSDWSKARFEEIRTKLMPFLLTTGFEKDSIRFIPVSGIKGVNLTKRVSSKDYPELAKWYKVPSKSSEGHEGEEKTGPCLVELLNTFPLPPRDIEKDLRIPVVDYFRGGEFGSSGTMSSGTNVSICGRIVQGCFQVGDTVTVIPGGEKAVVKSINVDYNSEDYAIAGDNVIVMLSGVDILQYSVGSMICSPTNPISLVPRFRAQIVVFDTPIPITKGYVVILHILGINEPAIISKLIELTDSNTGEVLKKSPRHLTKDSTASVEIIVNRPVAIDLFKNCKDLGRFALRKNGVSIASGIVTATFSE
ncbi:hypothetical protein BB560_003028 [Smittium megazygosporum]|uniref:Elongation factor 1 alpha-like protein n=1 Tax=Smittium megazygosporum TaxID=133381 RepID=A0A2T9ZD65_9FUNG|nr:hypothetical protein BB560_003028 [Smittium megazygosporum]